MGRAYEVRKASIAKTGAAKAKLYSTFAKEIYLAAKGNPEIETNIVLKRVVEKAKSKQVPSDIINRAIDKAKGNDGVDYQSVTYEGFGPGQSTFIIETLTDNVNRTVAYVREVFNKIHKSLGVTNSVSFNYDYEAVIGFKYDDSDSIFEAILDAGIDVVDLESEDGEVIITAKPQDGAKVKDVIEGIIPNVEYTLDERGWYPKDTITLEGEELDQFKMALDKFENIEDVTNIYHNVDLGE